MPGAKNQLTNRQLIFIDKYIELDNATQAAIAAGYSPKTAHVTSSRILANDKVKKEILRRQDEMRKPTIASAQEVMEYFTKVMKGEILDQFGLEAPLSERTRAAQELAKRTVDLENRAKGQADAEIKITLDWSRDSEE